jgi:hypothetical protein
MLSAEAVVPKEPTVRAFSNGKAAIQEWSLPTDTEYLRELISYIFENHWRHITWGALNEGASYELTCPRAPTEISFENGYLTVSFGGPHFHLCLGPVSSRNPDAPPVPDEYNRRLMPSKATIFRNLDEAGAPVVWGFDMKNGAGAPMITIFFASPFVTNADTLEKAPIWERLDMWRDISRRYLGREPEAFDESGYGYTRQVG